MKYKRYLAMLLSAVMLMSSVSTTARADGSAALTAGSGMEEGSSAGEDQGETGENTGEEADGEENRGETGENTGEEAQEESGEAAGEEAQGATGEENLEENRDTVDDGEETQEETGEALEEGNLEGITATETAVTVASYLAGGVENPEEYYDVWWNFEDSIWGSTAVGTEIIAEGGTSSATLTQASEDDGNHYMDINADGSGKYRVSRLNGLETEEEISGVELTFDWLPGTIQTTASSRFGDIAFYSSASTYAYFGLQFDRDWNIYYYTVGEHVESGYGLSYSEEELKGGLVRQADCTADITAGQTGITADGETWYTVKITFNYLEHTATLSISTRENADAVLFSTTVNIYESAEDLSFITAGGWKATVDMGIDNLGIRYLTDIPASYYYNVYWNDFEEETGTWSAVGTDVIAEGGTSAPAIALADEDEENSYLEISAADNGKYRVAKIGISDQVAEQAEASFDWLPGSIASSGSRFGDISFYSSNSTYAYFGLQFDKDYNIYYYTVGEHVESGYGLSYSEEVLEGGLIRQADCTADITAGQTGITADGNTWYTVSIVFDYNTATASLTISDRDSGKVLFSAEDIPIYASAMNISQIAAGGWKGTVSFGIDNLGVRYNYSDSNTIASVTQPAGQTVRKADLEDFLEGMPTTAIVTMGDGSSRELGLSEWICTPEFDEDTYGTYIWTAELILEEGMVNSKGLSVSLTMKYVKNYSITTAYMPATLEIEYGTISTVEEFEALLPTTTQVILENGKAAYAELDMSTWTAIWNQSSVTQEGSRDGEPPEFDPETEGTYVYKVMLDMDGSYALDGETWVEFRVHYYSTDDNYMAYERTIENLDRGLYAINNLVYDTASGEYVVSEQGGIYLSWRILVDEYELVSEGQDMVFEVYRNGELVTSLTNSTNYLDTDGEVGDIYQIKAIQNGVYDYSEEVEALEDNYISVELQRPLASYSWCDTQAVYRLNDTEVADVDGDGQYELIVKWYPTNGYDPGTNNSSSSPDRGSSPEIIDVYEMDGTALWRLYMGYTSPASQHYDNFIVYDMDEDGKAELGILTSDGTRTYRPDENGNFVYLTTDEGGYVWVADDPTDSESTGSYVLSEDGYGYVLSTEVTPDASYVGSYGSPVMDDTYLVSEVGDRSLEGDAIDRLGYKTTEANEYFTIFNGETGEAIDSVDYYYDTEFFMTQTENTSYSTVFRFNTGVGTISASSVGGEYEDTIPAIFVNRAYYSDLSMIAYCLVDGEIVEAWKIYCTSADDGGGNHNLTTGDLDNDGFDEIYMGGTCIDHDGTVLWAKDGDGNNDYMKHGDAIHIDAVFPDSDQLYVFTIVEDTSVSNYLNFALSNGATGTRIFGMTFGAGDTGRGVLANVTSNPGYELWTSADDYLYNVYGEVVTDDEGNPISKPGVTSFIMYWDGDLLSELPDSAPANGGDKSGYPVGIHKYNEETGETETIAVFNGTLTNNSTKNNPGLTADILGDWREEILVRESNNTTLRIYMTSIETDYTIYSLMQDSVYRNGVAQQNDTYNQPAHTSFYLGEDEADTVLNFELPTYNYTYATERTKYTDVTITVTDGVSITLENVQVGSSLTELQERLTEEGYTYDLLSNTDGYKV
ncbi:MAG: hypothetical protein LUC90_01925 [Lachnospiraceae bacterium]|nr:hypothetical protein [Lachnospiraceae bacterium]